MKRLPNSIDLQVKITYPKGSKLRYWIVDRLLDLVELVIGELVVEVELK